MNELVNAAPGSLSPVGVEELLEKFLLAHDVKPISRDGYRRRLRQFFLWCERKQIRTPDRETVLNFKRELQSRKLASSSISSYLVAVRCFFTWTESVKIYPNVAKSIKGTKREKGFRKDPLTLEQVHTLLNSIDRSTLSGKRDYALLNLMIRTGPRTIEIVRSNVEDVRQQDGETVLWLQGKGADEKDAFVVLTESALHPLREYLTARGVCREGDALFGSLSDRNRNARMTTRSIRRIAKTRLRGVQLESPRLTAHSCRHTTVTLALLGGASLQETQQLARHQDIRTTTQYAHNIERSKGIPEQKIEELLSRSS